MGCRVDDNKLIQCGTDRTSSRSDATESPGADINYDYMPADMFQSEA